MTINRYAFYEFSNRLIKKNIVVEVIQRTPRTMLTKLELHCQGEKGGRRLTNSNTSHAQQVTGLREFFI